jgi:hypothetical protein
MTIDVAAIAALQQRRATARRELAAAQDQLDVFRQRRDAARDTVDKIEAALGRLGANVVVDSNIPVNATVDDLIARLA